MTIKNKILVAMAIIAIAYMSGCLTKQSESLPGDSIELTKLANILAVNDYDNEKDLPDTVRTKSTAQIPQNRDDLDKMRTVVKVFNGKNNAGITLPGFGGLTLGKDESSLNVYYIETSVVNSPTDTVVYGCGYSIHYLFKKVEKGISVDNIPSIAASAQLNSKKTQVFYSLQTYGIKGNNLVKYFKPTVNKNFNVEGFGSMQSSIDGIHNILGDTALSKSIKFKPEILKFVKPYELEQL